MKQKIAIIAALPREVAPLIQGWQDESDRVRKVFVYTAEEAVVAYAGMGAARVELAVRASLQHGPISHMLSVGWAGGLKPEWAAGSIHHPSYVIDAATGQRFAAVAGTGTLVTVAIVADADAKRRLVTDFDADFVDMEAAIVARIATEEGIPFAAVKAIFDEHADRLPELQGFYTSDGWFREKAFAIHVALHPWLWLTTIRMGRSASASARNLCHELQRILLAYEGNPLQE